VSVLALYLIAALATSLMAGFFWSFSVAVMDGLRLLPPQEGMRAVQAINSAVRTPGVGLGFFGTPILCALVLLSLAWPGGRNLGGLVAASGAVLYLALGVGVTFARNVPLKPGTRRRDQRRAMERVPAVLDVLEPRGLRRLARRRLSVGAGLRAPSPVKRSQRPGPSKLWILASRDVRQPGSTPTAP